MANQGPNNTFNSGPIPGQPQMTRDGIHNPDQSNNFLQETGTHLKNMAQGTADVGKGAAQGVMSLARGAALGAASVAQGTADVVKNTIGANTSSTTGPTTGTGGTTTASYPSNADTRV